MGTCAPATPPKEIKNEPLLSPQAMMHHHITSNIPDSEKQRLFLQISWNKYYPSFVSKYSKYRNKFVCFQTLCHNLKIEKVENTKHRIHDKDSQECISIHMLFHITFSISYHKHVVHLSACIEFDDALLRSNDDPFDNMQWKQNIIVLEPIIPTKQGNQSAHIIHNGVVDDEVCAGLQNVFDFNENDDLVREYFTLFWQWFISKEVIDFKDKNIAVYETYRDTNKTNECEADCELSEREVINTTKGSTKGSVEDKNDAYEEMNETTKQFYIFLQQNGFQQYFDKFQANNCSDIEYISDFIKDDDYLQNDIGIKNKMHRARFIRECEELERQKHAFKQMIPSLLFQKLSKKYGIITVNILCKQVKNINELNYKYKIMNDTHCDLLWNIIESVLHPQDMHYQHSNEGTQHNKPIVLSTEKQAFAI